MKVLSHIIEMIITVHMHMAALKVKHYLSHEKYTGYYIHTDCSEKIVIKYVSVYYQAS